jgi:hypothetical protein
MGMNVEAADRLELIATLLVQRDSTKLSPRDAAAAIRRVAAVLRES